MTMTQSATDELNVADVKPLFHQEHYQTVAGAYDTWGREVECSMGQVMTLEVTVEASGRPFVFQAQQNRRYGHVVLPSNGRLTEYLEHDLDASEGYFELFKVLAEKHLGYLFTDATNTTALPLSVNALHRAVVEHLKAQLGARFVLTAEHFGE